jgi:hypothetical protein
MTLERKTGISVTQYVYAATTLTIFLAMSASAVELGSPMDTALGRQYRADIEVLTVSPKLLPASCRLVREVRTASIFPATTNPFVTDDAKLIRFVSLIGFGSDAIREISVAMSALYYDSLPQHEVGVWALRLKSAEAASTARSSISIRNLLVRDLMVATVWRDGDVGRACQSAIEGGLVKNGFTKWNTKR